MRGTTKRRIRHRATGSLARSSSRSRIARLLDPSKLGERAVDPLEKLLHLHLGPLELVVAHFVVTVRESRLVREQRSKVLDAGLVEPSRGAEPLERAGGDSVVLVLAP